MGKGQLQIGDWLDSGGGRSIEAMEETDPIEVLRTMYLLRYGNQPVPEGDVAQPDNPEGSLYFLCSARLLGKVIRTLEARRDSR